MINVWCYVVSDGHLQSKVSFIINALHVIVISSIPDSIVNYCYGKTNNNCIKSWMSLYAQKATNVYCIFLYIVSVLCFSWTWINQVAKNSSALNKRFFWVSASPWVWFYHFWCVFVQMITVWIFWYLMITCLGPFLISFLSVFIAKSIFFAENHQYCSKLLLLEIEFLTTVKRPKT